MNELFIVWMADAEAPETVWAYTSQHPRCNLILDGRGCGPLLPVRFHPHWHGHIRILGARAALSVL